MRIAVAMSGGVDSSVAALLLKEQGHEVVGLTMKLWACPEGETPSPARMRTCCSWRDTQDAVAVCERLGVRHFIFDLETDFERFVVRPFAEDYAAGRTPNPCVRCNEFIKFRPFLERARQMGFERIATGHYARVVRGDGRSRMACARDRAKDQTYFLFPLSAGDLAATEWPLGDILKQEVRAIARRAGLPNADKPESQDICFVKEGGYMDVVRRLRPDAFRPGPIVDRAGRVLGEHAGLPAYTVGQRRGIGVAARGPLYVVALDVERNTVVVGADEELLASGLAADNCRWMEGRPPARCQAKIRYRTPAQPCTVEPKGDDAVAVTFDAPQRAITPGQAVVFYDGEYVLGGGWIKSNGK
jgi:tRNA-uridine 2-sulfurtransferase